MKCIETFNYHEHKNFHANGCHFYFILKTKVQLTYNFLSIETLYKHIEKS